MTREGREDRVAGAVGEDLRLDGVIGLGGELPARDGRDGIADHLGVEAGAVEKEREVGLVLGLFIEYQVPDGVLAVGVAAQVVEAKLLEDTGFAEIGDLARAVGPADGDAALAGSVPSEDWAVMHEHDPGASPCLRRGRRRPRRCRRR